MLWRKGIERNRPEGRLNGPHAVSGNEAVSGQSTVDFRFSGFAQGIKLRIQIGNLVRVPEHTLRFPVDVRTQTFIPFPDQGYRLPHVMNWILCCHPQPHVCILSLLERAIKEPYLLKAVGPK